MHNIDIKIVEWVEPAQVGFKDYLAEEQGSESASIPSPNGVSLSTVVQEDNAGELLVFPKE
jgi:hypothetical protein